MTNKAAFPTEVEDSLLAEAVATVIKRYRKERHLSRDQMAFQLSLHKNTLYGVEVGVKRKSGSFGHTQLTLPNFVRIARFFGQKPGHFLDEVLSETNRPAKVDEF